MYTCTFPIDKVHLPTSLGTFAANAILPSAGPRFLLPDNK